LTPAAPIAQTEPRPPAREPLKPTASVAPWSAAGAASAPARAREVKSAPAVPDSPVVSTPSMAPATTPSSPVESETPVKTPAVAPAAEASVPAPEPALPTFTFGGANAPESSGGSKKIVLGLLAVVLVGGGAYAGWQYYSAHHGIPVTNPAPQPSSSPSAGQRQLSVSPNPAPAPVTPVAAQTQPKPSNISSGASNPSASDSDLNADSTPDPAAPVISKTLAKPASAPLVVKGGSVHGIVARSAVADAAPPSMIGLTGASAPPPNLISSTSAPKPLLQRVSISQGVSLGLLVKKVSPVYPATALQMHVEGPVQLQATISKDGNITDIKTISGDPTLVSAAKNAVKQWKYKPYLLNGEPVEIQTQITINFKLPK
jgi:periplasmic protein TonB